MGWFGGKSNVMKSRTRELNSQIERLEQQIANLEHVSTSRNATEIRTTLEETSPLPKDPVLSSDANPADLFPPEPDCPGLYNEQGVRKFDLHGLWLRLKKTDTTPEPTPNEKLVTYLAAGPGREIGHQLLIGRRLRCGVRLLQAQPQAMQIEFPHALFII